MATMKSPITLTSTNKEDLNKQIDAKLKERYLLKGSIQTNEDGIFTQEMITPVNIDKELTFTGGITVAITVAVYLIIVYFLF